MNKVILLGRLTRDPDVRYGAGSTVASYSLAVQRKFKKEGEPEADFFNCTCFDKQAEFAEKYLSKGVKILVTGRIENSNYTNRNGEQVYSVRVLVEEQEFAESKNANESNRTVQAPPIRACGPGVEDFMSIPDNLDDGELPFE